MSDGLLQIGMPLTRAALDKRPGQQRSTAGNDPQRSNPFHCVLTYSVSFPTQGLPCLTKGKCCIIYGRHVNKGIGMLQMSGTVRCILHVICGIESLWDRPYGNPTIPMCQCVQFGQGNVGWNLSWPLHLLVPGRMAQRPWEKTGGKQNLKDQAESPETPAGNGGDSNQA